MYNISIKKSKIIINNNLIDKCEEYIFNFNKYCKMLIITDINVSKIYLEKVIISFKKHGFQVIVFIVKPGEKSKSLNIISRIYKTLSINFMSSSDIIIGLGGGVILDIAGFVAATYNRGMKLIQIPTSLLAQVDASIGGKNGVNLKYGKNLVGTFYHPDIILIDPTILKTLDEVNFNSGMAEIIKCGCIGDKQLFNIIMDNNMNNNFNDNIVEIIYRSIIIKKNIIERDEFGLNDRMILNFGHTIGHALEVLKHYKRLSHGQAISIGMNIITKISENIGLTKKGVKNKLELICKKYFLPTKININLNKVCNAILMDKKIINNDINLIFIKDIGEGFIYNLPCAEVKNFIKAGII